MKPIQKILRFSGSKFSSIEMKILGCIGFFAALLWSPAPDVFAESKANTSLRSCVAHRGYSSMYLENSIQAFREAINVGAGGIELDLQHTKDGHSLVLHDETLERTGKSKDGFVCKVSTPVQFQTLHEIKKNCQLLNGENITTLAELFVLLQDDPTRMFIELKDQASKESLDLFRKYRKKIAVISLDLRYLNHVMQQLGSRVHIPYFYISKAAVPLADKFSGLGSNTISDQQIKDLKARNKMINIWTVNDEDHIRQLFARGVNYITTDEAELCVQILRDME